MKITTVGFDLAKNAFQVHGVDQHGKVVLKKQLRRHQVAEFFAQLPSCLIGMEACGGAHYWARRLQGLGHTRLSATKVRCGVHRRLECGRGKAARYGRQDEWICEATSADFDELCGRRPAAPSPSFVDKSRAQGRKRHPISLARSRHRRMLPTFSLS